MERARLGTREERELERKIHRLQLDFRADVLPSLRRHREATTRGQRERLERRANARRVRRRAQRRTWR